MLPALLGVLGGGLLTATLNVAGLRVGATPAELVLWGAAGALFARLFAVGALVLAVPVLVAGIELAAGSGATTGTAGAGDPLTLALPGGRGLALTDLLFAAAYGAWAQRFALRWRVTCPALGVVLIAAVLADGALPALSLLGLALLLPNVDRLRGLVRA